MYYIKRFFHLKIYPLKIILQVMSFILEELLIEIEVSMATVTGTQ